MVTANSLRIKSEQLNFLSTIPCQLQRGMGRATFPADLRGGSGESAWVAASCVCCAGYIGWVGLGHECCPSDG